jgi:hypothetical protein
MQRAVGAVGGIEQRDQGAGIDEDQRRCFFVMMSVTAFLASRAGARA